jgi:hypothetical protein
MIRLIDLARDAGRDAQTAVEKAVALRCDFHLRDPQDGSIRPCTPLTAAQAIAGTLGGYEPEAVELGSRSAAQVLAALSAPA